MEARQLIETFTVKAEPLAKASALAQWRLATDAGKEAEREAAEAQIALARLYADESVFAHAKALDASMECAAEPLLAREVHLLHLATLSYRRDPATLERIVRLETELEGAYSTHRGRIGGEEVTENRIRDVLRTERDLALRRAAWDAGKAIGPVVAPRVLELAKLRNQVARRLGFRDWFAMSLTTEELDEAWLLGLLERLAEETEGAFAAEKARIDAEASAWLGVPVSDLEPWHFQDPFFQEAPTTDATSIEPLLAERDVVAVARTFYEDLGFGAEVASILGRSDLYPRARKTQHAFCADIDRSGDVRIVCNVAPSERWLETTLHELGHGIYDLGIDPSLPWGLRAPSHTFTTEAIAMLMGRRTRDPELLGRYVGARAPEQQAADRALLRRRMLMLVRWVIVMTRFERELYREPVRQAAELGRIWWELVERYQRVERPQGERPTDWATKIHIALAPVYYQNYLLGELTASQIERAIVRATARRLVGNVDAAAFLRQRCFRPGASLRWDALVRHATGEPLSPDAFVRDFVG